MIIQLQNYKKIFIVLFVNSYKICTNSDCVTKWPDNKSMHDELYLDKIVLKYNYNYFYIYISSALLCCVKCFDLVLSAAQNS